MTGVKPAAADKAILFLWLAGYSVIIFNRLFQNSYIRYEPVTTEVNPATGMIDNKGRKRC